MTSKQTIISITTVFFLSLLGTGLWLYEIVEVHTWHSLAWLYVQLYSPFVVILMTATSLFTAFIVTKNFTSFNRLILGFILFYLLSGICYWTGKAFCYFIYRFMAPPGLILTVAAFFVLFVFLFFAFITWLILNKTVKANKKGNILLIFFLSFLSLPLSLLTVEIFEGFGSSNDWIDAVKMGYPIFWITMFLGGAGIVIARQPRCETR